MSTKQSYGHDQVVVPLILSCLGTFGQSLVPLWDSGEHLKLVSQSVDPKGFANWYDFALAYQSLTFLKKYPKLKTGIDTTRVALEKFHEAEESCRAINFKLTNDCRALSFRDRSIFEWARSEIKRILGVFSWDSVLPFLSHGPGAAIGLRREQGHQWYKYGKQNPSVTGNCLALVRCMTSYSSLWQQRFDELSDFDLVRASKVAVVPKDSRSGRTIAIEPLWNMFFQKGIGGYMRYRLNRSGCNLNDQTLNQRLAREGSIDGSLCTTDLKQASDCISRVLVERLLPEDWLEALKVVRTAFTRLPCGKEIFLQKFSSMGNGFTFELESLIFLALGRACSHFVGGSGRDVSVYGDDIVANRATTDLLIEVLSCVGFKTNMEKTFVDGPFRESCGKHFFLGHDVTPFSLKREIRGVEDLFYLLNSVRRLAFRLHGDGYGLDSRFEACYKQIELLVPPRFRGLSVPEGFGDTGIVRDFDQVTPRPRSPRERGVRTQVEGYETKHLVRLFASSPSDDLPGLMMRLTPAAPSGDLMRPEKINVIPLKRYKLRVARLVVPLWPALGPWVENL